MPLFMMVSGYFSLSSLDMPLGRFVKKKAVHLLLPCVTWGLMIYFIRGNLDNNMDSTDNFEYACNAYWFLKSLFLCNVLAYILRKSWSWLMKFNRCIASNIFGGSVFLFTLTISQMACFNDYRLWYMYPCFLLGIMLRCRPEYLSLASRFWAPIGIVFLAMLVMWNVKINATGPLFILLVKNALEGNFTDFHALQLGGYNLYKLIIGFVGSIAFIGLFLRFFHDNKGKSALFLANLGQYTMEIYILQAIILENIISNYIGLDDMGVLCYDFVFTPLMAFTVLLLCILITKLTYIIMKDFTTLNIILWGKRHL